MRKIISNLLQYCCFVLYPFIFLYHRYFKHKVNYVKGCYFKSLIKKRGKGVRVVGLCSFLEPDRISIGDYCSIGENAYFHATGGLTIGNNVQISRNVTIYTASHNFHSWEYIPYDNTELYDPVVIHDNVWIGRNVSILPGVSIGKNAIIGMGAIITKNVPECAIVVGHNRIVGYRDNVNNSIKSYGKEFLNA